VVADPSVFDKLYTYAWFVTFALSFIFYLILMRSAARQAVDAPAFSHPITES
jgi:cytosine/uracil/thiamine/allantoin permease